MARLAIEKQVDQFFFATVLFTSPELSEPHIRPQPTTAPSSQSARGPHIISQRHIRHLCTLRLPFCSRFLTYLEIRSSWYTCRSWRRDERPQLWRGCCFRRCLRLVRCRRESICDLGGGCIFCSGPDGGYTGTHVCVGVENCLSKSRRFGCMERLDDRRGGEEGVLTLYRWACDSQPHYHYSTLDDTVNRLRVSVSVLLMIMICPCKQAPHAIQTEYLVCTVHLSILY